MQCLIPASQHPDAAVLRAVLQAAVQRAVLQSCTSRPCALQQSRVSSASHRKLFWGSAGAPLCTHTRVKKQALTCRHRFAHTPVRAHACVSTHLHTPTGKHVHTCARTPLLTSMSTHTSTCMYTRVQNDTSMFKHSDLYAHISSLPLHTHAHPLHSCVQTATYVHEHVRFNPVAYLWSSCATLPLHKPMCRHCNRIPLHIAVQAHICTHI